MKKILPIPLILLILLVAGCGPSKVQTPPATHRPGLSNQPVTIVFALYDLPQDKAAYRKANAALAEALGRFQKLHPRVTVQFTATTDPEMNPNITPKPDLAMITAKYLEKMVGDGGVEPLRARLTGTWLRGFPYALLKHCKVANRLFAIPWLESEKPENSRLLIAFALSLQKRPAIELMKFLVTDPTATHALAQITGTNGARKEVGK
jgi:ABC-type glycerol-3-phosphate transport system substrate-binding protein